MHESISLNAHSGDANVSVYNKSQNKINQLISEDSSNNISGFTDLEEFVKSIPKPRKILIHINNTNPILREDSDERKLLEENGIEVSYDGMDIIL